MITATLTPGRFLETLPSDRFVRVEELPGSRDAAWGALSRASRRGDLLKLRRGLYFKGKRTRYGMARPSAEEVALAVLGKDGVGPTGFSAARAFGLTTQVPAAPEYAVAGPLPTSVDDVVLHRRNNMARRSLSYHEVAVLELLREWETVTDGSWTDLVSAVADAISRGRVRMARLARAAETEPSPKVREAFERLSKGLRWERRGSL